MISPVSGLFKSRQNDGPLDGDLILEMHDHSTEEIRRLPALL